MLEKQTKQKEGNMQIEVDTLIDQLARIQARIEFAVENPQLNFNIVRVSNYGIVLDLFLELGISLDKQSWDRLIETYKRKEEKLSKLKQTA